MNVTFEEVNDRNLKEKFELEFAKLNPAQQEAVAQIEGPVLVLAGPGTGKTQILSARIANILLETDVLPENILCLTYTDAGTVAMRKRLFRFIGADAYRVGIFTFHAFCNSVIQDNLHLFGIRNLDAVSEIEQIRFVHEIIDSFSSGNILKRHTGEIYYDTKRLLKLYAAMKKEGWTPEFILQKTEDYLQDLPDRKEFTYQRDSKFGKKGELKSAAIGEEKNQMQRLVSAVKTFDAYQQKLKANNVYDFADMINWVITLFKTNENLLAFYREKYQYVLVDEFQD
ncbi:MAG: UvrD-helicase domain-containing protein, partial [Bacteroidia bacterium]